MADIFGLLIGGAQAVGGAAQQYKADKLKKGAQKFRPPFEDPEMRQYLSYLERKRRAIETGATLQPQAAEIGRQLADTQSGIVQASGGAGGAAISGLLQSQRGAGQAFQQATDRLLPMSMQYTQMYGDVLSNISQRRADLQLHDYTSALADAAELRRTGNQNVMAGLGASLGSMTGTEAGNDYPSYTTPMQSRPVNSIPVQESYVPDRLAYRDRTIPYRENQIPMEGY